MPAPQLQGQKEGKRKDEGFLNKMGHIKTGSLQPQDSWTKVYTKHDSRKVVLQATGHKEAFAKCTRGLELALAASVPGVVLGQRETWSSNRTSTFKGTWR